MPPKNKTQKHKTCPPEICPTGECPRNMRWNVKTQKCLVKPYEYWGVKKDIDNGIRKIPEDVRDMVGEEIYKTKYEDEAIKRGEKIVLVKVPKNAQPAAIKNPPPPPPVPIAEPVEDKGPVVVRKPFKVSISKKSPIVVRTEAPKALEEFSSSEEEEQAELESPEKEKQGEIESSSSEEEKEGEMESSSSSSEEEKEGEMESSSSSEEDEDVEPRYEENNEHSYLYPHLDDPDFALKIANRKEFNDYQYDDSLKIADRNNGEGSVGSIEDIEKQASKLCSADFELMPHQTFVKNFMSLQTPYNSLLLYHGLGTGKTCSAIGVSEEMRGYMKQIGLKKSIMIIASPNVQDNFILQLFDERKLKLEDGIWTLNTCVGNSLLKEINPTDTKGTESDRENIISQVKSIIRQYYVFMGYTQFANFINESIEIKGDIDYSDEDRERIKRQRIKNIFNSRLVIIDEVHNIRTTKIDGTRKPADLLMEVARNTDSMKLLLLSATPMYNTYEEIIWLTNLMNLNDKRKAVKTSDIFSSDGKFIPGKGEELLRKKLNGYVSYVKGENPYTFPFRIYPEKDDSVVYPTIQMNQKPIELDKTLQYIRLFTNGIGEYQEKVYRMCIENLHKRGEDEDKAFEEKESFGYSLLQKPLEALNIVYPSEDYDPTAEYTVEEETSLIQNMIGKTGLANVMQDFEYKSDKYGRIFSPAELPKYSAKIAKFCEIVKKSEGIILIYTQYIDGGAVPIALALEEMGFARYSSDKSVKSLFKTPPVPPLGYKPEGSQARYVMITGDAKYSPNNNEDLKYLNSDENMDGKLVKVVIISRAAGEGIDFKNIRQVHVLEPWYNMNRIEQIIGRGVRNLSHCKLEFAKRNVEIFLHATLLGTTEESADMYVYRLAEQKAIAIGRVTRVLKEVAVDCLLNISQTNFTTTMLQKIIQNVTVTLSLSSGGTKDYEIGDKPRTEICDYMDNCEIKCYPNSNPPTGDQIKRDTYGIEFVEGNNTRIIQRIRNLFKERHFYTTDEIIEEINKVKKYPKEQIYSSLTRMIDNSNEYVVDKYGRLGHIVNNNDTYLFQPVEITDITASVYERITPVDFKHANISIQLQKRKRAMGNQNNYIQIVKNITDLFTTAFSSDDSNDNWYSAFTAVRKHVVSEYAFTEAQLKKHLIYHMIDNMLTSDKIIILNALYSDSAVGSETEVEKLIRQYFDANIITADNGDMGISLTTDNKSTRIYHPSENGWVEAQYVETANIIRSKDYRTKYVFRKQILNDVIGFTAWFEKGTRKREYVFKTKYKNAERNKLGRVTCSALAEYTRPILNSLVGEPNKYNVKSVKEYKINTTMKICVLMEVLMREFNDTKKEKVWYLNNERVLINGIYEMDAEN
jgi:hypothetical protein